MFAVYYYIRSECWNACFIVAAPAHSIRHSVGPQGPPFVAMSMGYPSSGLETSQVTDPCAAARSQPMVITAAGPQSLPSAWSGPPSSPYDARDNPQTGYSSKEGAGERLHPRTAGLGSFSVGFGPHPSNPDFIQSSMGSGGYGEVRYPMFSLEPRPPPAGSMPWDPKRGPPPWGMDMSSARDDYSHHMADQGQGQAFLPFPSPGPGPGQQSTKKSPTSRTNIFLGSKPNSMIQLIMNAPKNGLLLIFGLQDQFTTTNTLMYSKSLIVLIIHKIMVTCCKIHSHRLDKPSS
jgi:hypothetical protein